ncbi:MAG: glycosyltransferase family 4 protein [Anaerolineae bacterium]
MSVEILGLCIASFMGSWLIVAIVRRWAMHYLLDVPNERSSHTTPTPRGGGVGIVLMTLIPLTFFLGNSENFSTLAVFGIALIVAVVGWLDDRYSLPAVGRLLFHAILTIAAVLLVGAVTIVTLPILGSVILAPIIALLIAAIWIIGMTNIYNFMDGIDGIAGTQALIAGVGWMLLLWSEDRLLALAVGLIAASSAGFLMLNRPKAKIFMGDVGSTFLGFVLAIIPVLVFQKTGSGRSLVVGFLMVAPFALDGGFTIIRRAVQRENVLRPHRSHIYQRLIKLGYSHLQITSLYGVFAFLSVTCAILYAVTIDTTLMIVALLVPIMVFVLMIVGTTMMEHHHRMTQSLKTSASLS